MTTKNVTAQVAGEISVQQTEEKAALALLEQTGLVIKDGATEEFEAYVKERELWMSVPFGHNKSLAKQGTPFTVYKVATGTMEPDEALEQTSTREVYMYLARLQKEYTHETENGVITKYDAGSDIKILLDMNSIREKDFDTLATMVRKYGGVANVCLQQYPSKDAKKSPSHGIVTVSTWRPLSEMVNR